MRVIRRQDTSGNREVIFGGAFYDSNTQTNKWPITALGVTSDGTTYSALRANKIYAPIPSASSSTLEELVATTGWVNDPDKSTNVVHRTGNETITGTKVLSGGTPIKLKKRGILIQKFNIPLMVQLGLAVCEILERATLIICRCMLRLKMALLSSVQFR